jgi:peptidylprolyl isomerase
MRFLSLFVTLIAGLFVAKSSIAADAASADNILYLNLKDGRVVIQLMPELAPNHVARIKELVKQKFYDGIVWHRVMDGFMARAAQGRKSKLNSPAHRLLAALWGWHAPAIPTVVTASSSSCWPKIPA